MNPIYYIIPIIIVVVAVIIYKGRDIQKFLKKPETLERIKKYILVAEKYVVGTEKGQERLHIVCERLRDYLPEWAKKAVTQEMLIEAVNYVFEQLAVKIDGHTIAVDKEVK